jgi:hypothetical protein
MHSRCVDGYAVSSALIAVAAGFLATQARGFNPYKFGVVSGFDSHVTVVPYRQDNFQGVHGTVDDTPEKRLNGATVLGLNSLWVTLAGLSAVWAEENTREAIYRRDETRGDVLHKRRAHSGALLRRLGIRCERAPPRFAVGRRTSASSRVLDCERVCETSRLT